MQDQRTPQYYYRQIRFGPGSISPVVRALLTANIVVFLIQTVLNYTGHGGWLEINAGMTPGLFVKRFYLWQPLTYMFLHGSFMHIFFNMFFLWMFGTEVEQTMGSRTFGIYYFFCGIGAGLLTCLLNATVFKSTGFMTPTIGASGAIYGVLIAFGLIFPERMILVFFVLPVKALIFVIGMGLIELYLMVTMPNGGIAYVAHVGGMLFGLIFIRYRVAILGFVENILSGRLARADGYYDYASAQAKVDLILDKINREGMHKLSRSERNFLKEHIRRLRNRPP
ncbi:MAG TPA: rhomboid family intramembrane serine protease, partial [bacterium]|nr:rhomboid family intramembrane serine protease [bacterium]